ncbi:hypothetical protein CDIK_0579 [Cucumispora dikerogammari]|nr:hypothetical protein CDIK_0579 [Cucumispora dikerogammari]
MSIGIATSFKNYFFEKNWELITAEIMKNNIIIPVETCNKRKKKLLNRSSTFSEYSSVREKGIKLNVFQSKGTRQFVLSLRADNDKSANLMSVNLNPDIPRAFKLSLILSGPVNKYTENIVKEVVNAIKLKSL